ncbi:hypothetical protein [Paraburkholderia caballeronis]|uniref:Uncharacterized protein n=1 Tax=Paraburkholderia caballeronis TaxID=416943 RepID=A0A1H7TKA2_9BURK|nr:hypothetical protein [Paraburkholderia caballeronis]PXW18429.1 hypothetical protein C7403_116114 [Paraburkholderia caballeronis]PXW95709.1 hypothetical protein C7407_116114 [Paraburkholderia caballeronis]RAJ92055.1 hypothetical protein C7409_116114 [Paraburkholderia caballeronis]SEB76342.1 hypothetical protein SAMN05445871_1023 [Paraburkholderia caballeronis]SEL85133.1 hypothetical protein SAMN05192542_115114 [Paraburkholderia caballeronis]
MTSTTIRTAVLEAVDNAPALDTGAPLELQFAVKLGATCADAWLELKGTVRLHDYAAHQADAFSRGLSGAMHEAGEFDSHRLAVSRQAFAAGMMGRVQQHLLAALGMVTRDERVTH